jgi:hypothetical protein
MNRIPRLMIPAAALLALVLVAPPARAASEGRISFVTPGANQKLTGRVELSVSTDESVASVEFLIDGVALGPPDTTRPYAQAFDASAYPQGFYTLSAVARDPAGQVVETAQVTVFAQSGVAQATIPATHPRLILVDGRLEELRRLACYDASGNPIPGCTRTRQASTFLSFMSNESGEAEVWQWALLHMITGDEAAATTAIQKADALVSCGWLCVKQAHGDFLYVRDYMRNVALVYDWLHDRLTPQQRHDYISYMNLIMFLTWNETPDAQAIYDTSDWMTSNPMNNFFYTYILAETYVALAIEGEDHGTFTNNGTTYNAYYLMKGRDANSDRYTDHYDFLMAKINEQMLPSLDTRGKGGGWFEGENYGRASKRHLFEALLMLKQTAGLDLFNNPAHPFCRQALYYELYSIQPGDGLYYPGGDQPSIAQAPVRGYSRHFMLLIAEGMRGTVESEYAQYWCDHVLGDMDDIDIMKAWDFVLYHPEFPERDHKAALPPHYLAEAAGWAHSRSDWSDAATSVVMVSTHRIEGHQHRDQNAFVIYKGGGTGGRDGWVMTDVMPFSGENPDGTRSHNTILVNDTDQRWGTGTGKILTRAAGLRVRRVTPRRLLHQSWALRTGDERCWVFQRELVHILPNYIAVFDRVVPEAGFESAVIKNLFHYPYNKPAVAGDLITETLGAAKLFHKVVLPATPALAWVDESSSGHDTWRLELQDATVRPSYLFMNVFQASAATVTAMAPTERVTSKDGGMTGAVIKDAVQHHVIMFSADPSGATPTGSIIYEVGANLPSSHKLFDLAACTGYRVAVARREAMRVITVSEGGAPPKACFIRARGRVRGATGGTELTGFRKSMRILVLTAKAIWPLHGGAEIRNFSLLKETARHHETSSLSFLQRDQREGHVAALAPYCRRIETVELPPRPRARRAARALWSWAGGSRPLVLAEYWSDEMRAALDASCARKDRRDSRSLPPRGAVR